MKVRSVLMSVLPLRSGLVAGLVLAFALTAGCDDGSTVALDEEKPLAPVEEMFPELTDRDLLLKDAPSNDTLPMEGKMDAVYPAQFDLISTQSPVRNQARRGVCSIFSTVGLMEHLYIKEGTITQPDFSEQFLQWSAKVEVGSFQNTEGSSAQSNLDAINRYGIVTEDVWPYETSAWNTSNDPACTGEDRPVICYTNGNPSETVLAAQRWKLPKGRYVNSATKSIKAVMTEKKVAVIAGMDFFYQSWNHGGSTLPTNRDYFSEGYVLAPNAKDKELSLQKRAGHSILLVGWDDTLEVPIVDEEGKQVLDADGNPVVEKGFFLFKNSWGSTGFGLRNKFGAGYGWLSYKYIQQYASVYTSDVPKLDLVEDCTDGKDNNFNNLVDCEDSACAAHDACRQKGTLFTSAGEVEIPDNGAAVTSTIDVTAGGTVVEAFVKVEIKHPYIGDLVVAVLAPNGQRVALHDRSGGSDDDIKATFKLDDLAGVASKGTWTLEMADKAGGDKGKLVAWSVELITEGGDPVEECGEGDEVNCANPLCADNPACLEARTITKENTEVAEIPDGDTNGHLSEMVIEESGKIQSFKVGVNITHPYRGDLVVSILGPDGTFVTLSNQEGEDQDNLIAVFDVPDFIGKEIAGSWLLEVIDASNLDSGTLNSWSIEALVK